MTFRLAYFGKINFQPVEEYYDVVADVESHPTRISLNFLNERLNHATIETIQSQLDRLPLLIEKAKDGIKTGLGKSESIDLYVSHHLAEIDDSELATLFEGLDPQLTDQEKIVEKLFLQRIGFYPDEAKRYIEMDFTIGNHLTQYVLMVVMNPSENISRFEMES